MWKLFSELVMDGQGGSGLKPRKPRKQKLSDREIKELVDSDSEDDLFDDDEQDEPICRGLANPYGIYVNPLMLLPGKKYNLQSHAR